MARVTLEQLRSQRWFAAPGRSGAAKHFRMRQGGFTAQDVGAKPVIGIYSAWSDFNTCHGHFPQRIEDIKRGIWQAGGFPAVIPVQSVSESYARPTSMLYRNLLAMEVEEAIRSYPVDGAILLGGCDKTTPGLVMGAASAGVPSLFVPAGAMLRGRFHGEAVGAGSSGWKAHADMRAGVLSEADWREMNISIVRSAGTCNTMGTASTMTSLMDVLGLTLPGASSIPAVDAAHARMGSDAGRRIVDMVWEGLTLDQLVTPASLRNTIVTDMALSGSTNSLIHLIAIARRLGIMLTIDDFVKDTNDIPVICNLMPSGKYLMEDFYFAGGLLALLKTLSGFLDLSCLQANGRTLGENIADAEVYLPDVIRPLDNPLYPSGGLVVLKGNLAPRGAIIKRAAASPALLQHTGPAIVFRNFADYRARIEEPDLDITPDHVMVMQDSGPTGAPGMPEWGMLPLPKKLLLQGVRDMVRISDARMSGTSFGTVVLHVCPESRVGGPLGLVRDGDMIRLDTANGRLDVLVSDEELEARRSQWVKPERHYARGYGALFEDHVLQADEGCDFDFLARPGVIEEPLVIAP